MSSRDQLLVKIEKLEGQVKGLLDQREENARLMEKNNSLLEEVISLEEDIDSLDYKLKEVNKECVYYSHDRDRYYKALEEIGLVPKGIKSGRVMREIAKEAIYRDRL